MARADLPRLALAGVLGYTVFIVLSTVGLARTTAFSTALLVGTAPLFAALMLGTLGIEAIRRRQVGGMAVAFAGVVVFLADKMIARLGSAGLGDLLCLAGACFFAAYSVASKPLGARYSLPVMMAYTSTIGAIPGLANCYVAMGYGGNGITWSQIASISARGACAFSTRSTGAASSTSPWCRSFTTRARASPPSGTASFGMRRRYTSPCPGAGRPGRYSRR